MRPGEPDVYERRVVVLAPEGRDADVVLAVLQGAQYDAIACNGLSSFVAMLDQGAAVGILTEETLRGPDSTALVEWLARQPPWSDFPLLVLATRQVGRRKPPARAMLEGLGHVVLLERPLNAETLTSATRAASRTRDRQYETRFHLLEQQRLYAAERRALQAAAESRDALLALERNARAQAELASRTKDEFLATLSHELRTPLSAILGWVYVLKTRVPTAADLGKGMDVIERNARAQASLIDELLDMSRIIAGSISLDLQPLDPSALVDSAIASISPSADAKSIRLDRYVEPGIGPVMADPHRLPQIIWNLLSNAVKFTPVGGTIEIGVSRHADALEVVVQDSGEGIDPAFLPFIFDRFRQGDGSSARRHGGLGLGLSIVRNLAELHGGSVRAESEGAGRGARLTVRLPLLQEATTSADPNARKDLTGPSVPDTSPSGLEGVRILVVDDMEDSREMIARILGEYGAVCRLAGSAAAALKAVALGPIDLLISDIGMPFADGYDLLRQVRARGHQFPAVALTAFARKEDTMKARSAGFAAHLAKPFEATDLVALAARLSGKIGQSDPRSNAETELPDER